MEEGESKVKQVLSTLWSYLYSSLPLNEDFIIQLENDKIIDRDDVGPKLRASARLGRRSCIQDLIYHMYQFFDEPTVEKFCASLDKYGHPTRPLMLKVAAKIREEMGLKPPPVHELAPEDPQKGTSKPRADVGDDTSSADVSQHVYYPVIDDLRLSFSNLASNVLSTIDLLSSKNLKTFCTNFLLNYLKPSFPPNASLPVIPKTVEDLKPFLASRWDPLQIALLKAVVEYLASRNIQGGNFKATVKKVKAELNAYEDLLKSELPEFLSKCRSESVSLESYPGQSSVSVKIASNPAGVSLSRIVQLRGFFIRNLGFRDTLFAGFSEGSIVLFFSIPTKCVWSLPSCLLPSNLSQLEKWKVLFFSVKGAFTVDIKERRVIDSLDKEKDTVLREVATQVQEDDTLLQEMVQQLQDQKEELENEITSLKENLSKDGQSRMLAEILESVKSELHEQISAFGKDSAQLQQDKLHAAELREKDETIARKNKEIGELKLAEKNDFKSVLVALRTEIAENKADVRHALKEVGGGGPAELEAKKLISHFQDVREQLDLIRGLLEEKDTQRQKEYTVLREVATQVQEDDTLLQMDSDDLPVGIQARQPPPRFEEKDNRVPHPVMETRSQYMMASEPDTEIGTQETGTPLQEKDPVTLLQEKDTKLQEKDTKLQEKDTKLQEKDTQIAKLLEEIQRLEQENNQQEKDTQPLDPELLYSRPKTGTPDTEIGTQETGTLLQLTQPGENEEQHVDCSTAQAVTMEEGGSKVKQVLSTLWSYLYSSLPPNEDFIIQLEIGGILARNDATKLRASARLGGRACIHHLIIFMYDFFDEPALETFCTFLDKYGQPTRPLLLEVAAKIREEIGLKLQPVHELTPDDPQKGTSRPRADVVMAQCGNPSRYAATKPTERYLKVVADRAGRNWNSLLTSLDIPWATIENLRAQSPDRWDTCMKGLVLWLNGVVSHDSSEPVTFGTLFAALKDSGMADCVSLLVDRLDERSTPHPRPTHEDKDEDLSIPPSKREKKEKDTQIAKLLEEIQRLKQENNLLHQTSFIAEKPASSIPPAKPFKPGQNKVFRSDLVRPGEYRQSVKMPDLLVPIYGALAVTIGRDVYLAGGGTGDFKIDRVVQVYNMDSGVCRTLPPSPQYYSEAVAINGTLVLIGGRDYSKGKPTNMVSTWMATEKRWTQDLPAMKVKRVNSGVLLLKNHLFVFGGVGEDEKTRLDSFEVLDLNTKQWSENRGGLPQPLYSPQLGVFGNYVMLYGGVHSASTSTRACYTIQFQALVDSVSNPESPPIHWTPVQDAPNFCSALLTTSQDAVLIGGENENGLATRAMHRFNSSGSWEIFGELLEPRSLSTVIAVSDKSFLVLGGFSDRNNVLSSLLKSVEVFPY